MKRALRRLANRLFANLHGDSISTLIGWPGVPPADNGERMCRPH